MKFTGTENYVATDDLRMAVDAAVALQRPLLIKGSLVPVKPCLQRRLLRVWA